MRKPKKEISSSSMTDMSGAKRYTRSIPSFRLFQYKFVNRWELECGCAVRGEGEYEGEGEPEECSDEDSRAGRDLDDTEVTSDVECTLAIIKPEARVNRSAIERRILEEGFAIEQTRWLQMTSEQISEFYCNNYDAADFAHLVAYMSSGPIVVHVLAKKEAVQEWRLLMGPAKVILQKLPSEFDGSAFDR